MLNVPYILLPNGQIDQKYICAFLFKICSNSNDEGVEYM